MIDQGITSEENPWTMTTYGSFPVPYNTETDEYGVTGGQESASILSNVGINDFQAFESNQGNGGGLWDTVGDVWQGLEPAVNRYFSGEEEGSGQQPQPQQPLLIPGAGGSGINTNQLITWGAVAGLGILLYQNM